MLQNWRLVDLSLFVSICVDLFLACPHHGGGADCQRVSLEFPTWDKFLEFKKEQEEMLFLSFSLRREGRKTQDGKVYKSFQCCHHGHPLSWCVVSIC